MARFSHDVLCPSANGAECCCPTIRAVEARDWENRCSFNPTFLEGYEKGRADAAEDLANALMENGWETGLILALAKIVVGGETDPSRDCFPPVDLR